MSEKIGPVVAPNSYTFTADHLFIGEEPVEIVFDDVHGQECPRHELMLTVERWETQDAEGVGKQKEEVAQLYVQFNEPTDFYPDGALQWNDGICRNGIRRMTLSSHGLRLVFFKNADMRVRGSAPPVKQTTLLRELAVQFAGSGREWRCRLEAALQRLCKETDSYVYTPASEGGRLDGAMIRFRLTDKQRQRLRRRKLQATCDQRLFDAIRGGDVSEVEAALQAGANPNTHQGGDWMMPPLMAAAAGGRTEIVRLLLDQGADVNGRDAFEKTALIAAAAEGFEEVLRLLLEHGADVHATGREIDFGHPTGAALDEAHRKGHTRIVQLLRAAGGKG